MEYEGGGGGGGKVKDDILSMRNLFISLQFDFLQMCSLLQFSNFRLFPCPIFVIFVDNALFTVKFRCLAKYSQVDT